MKSLQIIPDLEAAGFKDGTYSIVEYTEDVVVGGMSKGTTSGKPVVMIGLDMGDHILVVETTLRLFLTAADTLKAKYGDPRL
jgi:hypothetical protein